MLVVDMQKQPGRAKRWRERKWGKGQSCTVPCREGRVGIKVLSWERRYTIYPTYQPFELL